MAEAGAHEVVAAALQKFPGDPQVVARATGLLANMSNVPCVCPILERCGVLTLAQRVLEGSAANTGNVSVAVATNADVSAAAATSQHQQGQDQQEEDAVEGRRAQSQGGALLGEELARGLGEPGLPFVRDFVQYLLTNLHDHSLASA